VGAVGHDGCEAREPCRHRYHEDDAVDVWRLAKEDLPKLDIHLAVLTGTGAALWIRVQARKAAWKRSSQREAVAGALRAAHTKVSSRSWLASRWRIRGTSSRFAEPVPAADGVERVFEDNTRIAGTPLGQRFTHGVEVLLFLGQGAECTSQQLVFRCVLTRRHLLPHKCLQVRRKCVWHALSPSVGIHLLFYARIAQSSKGKSPTATARAGKSDELDTRLAAGHIAFEVDRKLLELLHNRFAFRYLGDQPEHMAMNL
jgi:hypothetical protein